MKFIGNQKVLASLQKSLERGMLNHAYIFSGPEHVGKFTLAKMFALGAIGGKKMELEIDSFDKDALLDLIVVSPEIVEKKGVTKKRDISIESVRDAKSSLSLFPYRGKYKVLIIDEAHKMNVSAQNALLKILEEPNATTMMILVTSETGKMLPTIQSRVQNVNFGLVGDAEMQKHFSEDIAELAVGRPGLAEIISQDENEREFRVEAKKQLEKIFQNSMNEKLQLAEDLSKDVVKTLEKLDAWTWELRKKALLVDENERNDAYDKMEKIQKSIETLKNTNANARLVLEDLFVNL